MSFIYEYFNKLSDISLKNLKFFIFSQFLLVNINCFFNHLNHKIKKNLEFKTI